MRHFLSVASGLLNHFNSGKSELAQQYLDKILKHTNHLGIFSEDIDPLNGSQWGNFGSVLNLIEI